MVLDKLTKILTPISLVVGIVVGLFVIADRYSAPTSQDPPAKRQAAPTSPSAPPPTTGSIPDKPKSAPAEPPREKYLLEELEEWWRGRVLGEHLPLRDPYFRD